MELVLSRTYAPVEASVYLQITSTKEHLRAFLSACEENGVRAIQMDANLWLVVAFPFVVCRFAHGRACSHVLDHTHRTHSCFWSWPRDRTRKNARGFALNHARGFARRQAGGLSSPFSSGQSTDASFLSSRLTNSLNYRASLSFFQGAKDAVQSQN